MRCIRDAPHPVGAGLSQFGGVFELRKKKMCVVGTMNADGTMSESGYENLKKAKVWYEKSAAQGYKPARQALSQIGELFQWAERKFSKRESNT